MSEYTKSEVRAVVQALAVRMDAHPDELRVAMVAVVVELLGDWQAVMCGDGVGLAATASRLQKWLEATLADVSSAMDRYFTEPMVQCLWLATYHHPLLRGARIDGVVGQRCSAESIVIALALAAILEQRRSRCPLYAGATIEDLLGLNEGEAVGGVGGVVGYVESLLSERCSV